MACVSTVHLCVVELERDRERFFKSLLLYLPQIIKGLLKIPLYIPTAASSSVSTTADVPMAILSCIS